MLKFSGSAGHNTPFNHGAVFEGYSEDVLARGLWNRVMRYLKDLGVSVTDCTPTDATSQNDSLSRRCKISDNSGSEYYMDTHFNMGRGRGVECFYISEGGKVLAERLCKEVSAALGIPNRGAKYDDELYVLKHTKAKAVLLEVCFLDSDDMLHYNEDKAARAIIKAITGQDLTQNKIIEGKVENMSILELQKLCNRLGCTDYEDKALVEDGVDGPRTQSAKKKLNRWFQFILA